MKIRIFCTALPLLALAIPALAGETLFSRAYTTETVPAGHYELEQLVRNRTGRAFGSYSAWDFRTEFEYGVTDNFQAAFYVNYGHVSATGAPDDDDPDGGTGFTRNKTYLQGFSGEFIYRVFSPVSDPIGLAFYIEPEVLFTDFHDGLEYNKTFETEYRIILQKNLLEDQLILVANTTAEVEFVRFNGESDYKGELDWNNEIGASYRFAANWYGGVEFRNHNELGNFSFHEHSVYWIGPVVHYGGPKLWVNFGILKQIAGNPNGYDADGGFIGDGKFMRSHEDWETSLKVGFPF